MLSDISNRTQPAPSSPVALKVASFASSASGATNNNNKRPLLVSSESDRLLPSKFRLLASSSSSSSPAPSSPYFPNTHLDAFHAPSSPSSLKVPTSPVHRFSTLPSLPPSSPSFGLSSSSAALDDELDATTAVSTAVAARKSASSSSAVNLDTLQTFHLERGLVLYFGRKAKQGIPRPSPTSTSGTATFIPILLPKTAKNASRLHCSTRLLPAEDEDKVTVEIRVTGMNGMKVDGKLYRQGSVALSTVEPGRRMKLSFWGWDAQLVVAESEVSLESEDDGLSDGEDESRWRASSPPSSGDDEPAPSRRAGSSPSSATSLSAANLPSAPRASSPALSDISSVSSTPSRREAFDRASALVSSLNLDLPGLIASAIVFHPRATVAVDEITRALLRETGSLWRILGEGEDEEEIERTQEREDEAVKAWREVVEDVLTEEEMFGAIDNSGLKDAAGQPVPSLFYYSPDDDHSRDRVAALEPFVKRVRGARAKGGVRYFWAKPSLKKNR